jgi:DNA-3-methyladenine glycosylase
VTRPDSPTDPILPRDFFLAPTLSVARALLGKTLVRRFDDGRLLRCPIVETEAYTADDPACHAFRGKSVANGAMFGPPGTAYVHINYGIHSCLNVVCQPEGIPEAVLIRAVEPPDGMPQERTLWAGPGRLTKSLEITKPQHDHTDLCDADAPIFLTDGIDVPDDAIVTTTRIGITKAADSPWRFYVRASRFVSRR